MFFDVINKNAEEVILMGHVNILSSTLLSGFVFLRQ